MVDKNSCFPVCYQHQLRPFIECKTVVLRGLSFDFFEQVIVKPLLGPNSNTPEDLCYKILQKKKTKNKKKPSFIYFFSLSHELRRASQAETDLQIEHDEMM